MSPNSSTDSTAQLAVWYFVSATFAFASTSFFPDAPLWARIVLIAGGFVLVVLGGIRLTREITARRSSEQTPPEH